MGKLNKIIVHWTAGHRTANKEDKEHYHYVIDVDGLVHTGIYSPEDNQNCQDGKYAKHCGGGNTGAIGVAICGMYGFNSKTKKCKDEKDMISRLQAESMFAWIAYLCKKYDISYNQVLTHAEFGLAHPKSESAGKIDISYIPWENLSGIKECGDYIRNKVKWYIDRTK